MEREHQEANPGSYDAPESDHEPESKQTRRAFLKRSAGLLVYVAPFIETFDVDDAEGEVEPTWPPRRRRRRRRRGRVSPVVAPPPPPPPPPRRES